MLCVRTTQICKVPATSDAQLLPLLLIGINCLWPKANHTRRSGRAYVLCVRVCFCSSSFGDMAIILLNPIWASPAEKEQRALVAARCSLCVLFVGYYYKQWRLLPSRMLKYKHCSWANIICLLANPLWSRKTLCSNQLGEWKAASITLINIQQLCGPKQSADDSFFCNLDGLLSFGVQIIW